MPRCAKAVLTCGPKIDENTEPDATFELMLSALLTGLEAWLPRSAPASGPGAPR
jgi:hypothetical protein